MIDYREPESDEPGAEPDDLPRLYLREPGWRVGHKVGSAREFCYQMAPGQDSYHRLSDGEIFVYHGDERLCIPCACRRGLIHLEGRALRPPVVPLDLAFDMSDTDEYPVRS